MGGVPNYQFSVGSDIPAGRKNPPGTLETAVVLGVEGMGRDRYGMAFQYCLVFWSCEEMSGVCSAIAPNSSALDGLRKG